MRKLRVVWSNWVMPIIVYALIYFGFRWLDFDTKQSIAFTVIFGTGYFWLKELDKKTEKTVEDDFTPYRVTVRATNWHDLLFKCRLVKDEDEWEHLCEKVENSSILQRGLTFTVLSNNNDGLPHLIWWDDHKIFQAGLPSFEGVIDEIQFQVEPPSTWKWSPRLYFGYRHGKAKGYTLALWVWKEWWDTNKTPDIANTEIAKEYHTGSVYLILGTLPVGEMGLDYEKRGQKREKELTALGWTIKDSHDPELPGFDTIEVENDFFSVSQHYCVTD